MKKKILLSILVILLVGATFFVDYKFDAGVAESAINSVEFIEGAESAQITKTGEVYSITSGQKSRTVMVLNNNAVLRLAPKTSADISLLDTVDFGKKILINLHSGRIWVNTISSAINAEINTGTIRTTAEPGIFDIQYGKQVLLLAAIRHSVSVEFLGNSLVVPENRQMSISEAKIKNSADTISRLRYSKLLKEFPYNKIEKRDEWMSVNSQEDADFYGKLVGKRSNEIKNGGPKVAGSEDSIFFKIKNFVLNAALPLTIDPQKRSEKEISLALNYFDSAVYALLIGDRAQGKIWLDEFAYRAGGFKGTSALQKAVKYRQNLLAFAQPTNSLFDARAILRDYSGDGALVEINLYLNDVLDVSAIGADAESSARVLSALRKFGSRLSEKISGVSDSKYAKDVLFEYIVFNDFLNQNSRLSREEFLRILELFEKGDLSLIASREEANDQRQFFIGEKIKKIRSLKILLEAGEIPFQDIRRSILLLAQHIDALTPLVSDTAVLSYFGDQMKDLSPFIAFLRSGDAEDLHGSYEENFSEFQALQNELNNVNQLLDAASGGAEISAYRREELAGIVNRDFSPEGIKDVKITLPERENDVRVKITYATLEGQVFTADYDTAEKVFSKIVIGSDPVPNSVRLANIRKFFLIKSGKMVVTEAENLDVLSENPEVIQTSILEKVAKQTLLNEFKKMEITVEDKNLDLKDFGVGVIHVLTAQILDKENKINFSCDVAQNAGLVENLKVQTDAGEISVNGTFVLQDLAQKVKQIYAQAVLDKQRQQEIRKILDENVENLPG